MDDIFIQEIIIENLRNLQHFIIPLSSHERRNLIITGKNGSGKTTLIDELSKYLLYIEDFKSVSIQLREYKKTAAELSEFAENRDGGTIRDLKSRLKSLEEWFKKFGQAKIVFNKPHNDVYQLFRKGEFLVASFEAKRKPNLKVPEGVRGIESKPVYGVNERPGEQFIQYIVNLKADRSFAREEGDTKTVNAIDEWFTGFESNLFQLFDINRNVSLQFDRKSYNFNILEAGKEPYTLNQLSDGYAAIFSIVTDLIIRMEQHNAKNYDVQGIVLIDEIETHLHVDLQKKILPFLTSFFPKIQFIVTTHSPFVVNSISNAVICDLEKRLIATDLSGYSYDTLIESYFNSDKYSNFLKERVAEFEALSALEHPNEREQERLFRIKEYLNEIPKFVADELAVKIQQILLKNIKRTS